MISRGFTVVELLIVIAIMGILLVVGVVNLRGSQVSARDTERKIDVDTIAIHLEQFYTNGGANSSSLGRYPSTAMFDNTEDTIKSFLRDINLDSVTAPGASDAVSSFVPATTSTVPGVSPTPSISTYVYQPLDSAGSLCEDELTDCRKFNLYYVLEADSSTNYITSRHQ